MQNVRPEHSPEHSPEHPLDFCMKRYQAHISGLQCLLLHKCCMPKPNVTLLHKAVNYFSEFATNECLPSSSQGINLQRCTHNEPESARCRMLQHPQHAAGGDNIPCSLFFAFDSRRGCTLDGAAFFSPSVFLVLCFVNA